MNDLVDLRPVGARLQINANGALVEAPAERPDLRQHIRHVRIVLKNLSDLKLVLHHQIIRRAFDRLGSSIDLPDVFAGQEAFGNHDRQIYRTHQQRQRNGYSRQLVP